MNQKNYDPYMHTAEHLLNGIMVRKFSKGRSFSQSIERRKSKCDYKGFDRNLTEQEIKEIETELNLIIDKDIKVTEKFMPLNDAKDLYNIDKLPDNVDSTIRIVEVGEFDVCPCIGPHVKSTSEIGYVKIISSSFENEILRVRFKRIKNPESN